MKNIIGIILFVLSGIPLIAYPFVLVADAMTLAAFMECMGENHQEIITAIIVIIFLIVNSTYPITYILSLICFIRKKGQSILIPLMPVLHFFIAAALFFVWSDIQV